MRGTIKHTYARDLLRRYQAVFGYRGLELEESYKKGELPARYGEKESVRLDVRDVNTDIVYDYNFTQNPPGLTGPQIRKIVQHGPAVRQVVEVTP